MHNAFVEVWQRASTFDPALRDARTWHYAILRYRAEAITMRPRSTDPT